MVSSNEPPTSNNNDLITTDSVKIAISQASRVVATTDFRHEVFIKADTTFSIEVVVTFVQVLLLSVDFVRYGDFCSSSKR